MFLTSKQLLNYYSYFSRSYWIDSLPLHVTILDIWLNIVILILLSCFTGLRRLATSILSNLNKSEFSIRFCSFKVCFCERTKSYFYDCYRSWLDGLDGRSFVTDKEKEIELIIETKGARIKIRASFKPPISLSHPKIVPLLLSYIYLLLESLR